jgi:plastocyanin
MGTAREAAGCGSSGSLPLLLGEIPRRENSVPTYDVVGPRMRAMKGARALASGMLVLAAICAAPAVSAAQDAGTTTDATTTTTTTTAPDPTVPPVEPATTPDGGHGKPTDSGQEVQAAEPAPPAPEPAPVTVASPTGKAHASASASVNMGDFFFSPASVTVAVGDTVTWHNSGKEPHTATADDGSFDTGTINSGGSGSHTFNSAGTFSYICTIHPNMKGTVRVLSSSSGGGSGGSAGSTSSGSSNSEASAVASPNAAGTSTTLPMTGMAVGSLALVGLALLAAGVITRRASEDSGGRRWLSIF